MQLSSEHCNFCWSWMALPATPDRAIKAGFEPDAGRWDESMEPQIKHCENGARRQVSEVVKSLEQPPCLLNANAILKESVLFCSLRVLTSNHRAEKIHPGIPKWRKGSGGGSGQVSGSGKHIPTSRVNPRAHTLSKALPCAHRGSEFIRVPRSCCIKLPPANAALTLSKMQSKLPQSIEVSGTCCPFTIMYKK